MRAVHPKYLEDFLLRIKLYDLQLQNQPES